MAISKSTKVRCSSLDFVILNFLTQDIWDAITSSKLKYYESLANKLNNPKTAPKSYWKILKTFLSGTKIPLIPPLLVRNQLVSDFFVKANLFNDYFSKQCMIIYNNSSIPANISFETDCLLWNRLSTFEICSAHIVKIIRSLDLKAHGYDKISIHMIKICTSSISKPLFRNCLGGECFPKEWKKTNIVPVHKKIISNWSKSIDQYHYCQFVLKVLKKWYLTCFLNT